MNRASKTTGDILDRQPPRSLDAERGTLGSILLLPDVCDDVAAIVRPIDFYDAAHQRLFAHLLGMRQAGQAIDSTLLVERLKGAGDLEFIGGIAFIMELMHAVPTAAHAAHYAKIVRENSKRRRLIHLATELLSAAYDSSDAGAVIERHQAELEAIDGDGPKVGLRTAAEACAAALSRAADLVEGRGAPSVLTRLSDVDGMIGGLFPGELIVLAARPRVGKSALAARIAAAEAMDGGRVAFFSSEMGADELALRTLCTMAGVSGQSLRTGRGSRDDVRLLAEEAQRLSLTELLIDDRASVSLADIRVTARRLHRERPLTLIVIDYLQRLKPADSRRQRHEQVGQMATDAKSLARELRVPVLLLAQVGRESERSGDGRPTLAMLRESGSIEAEADTVLLLHRAELQKPNDADLRGKAELIVAKNRNGATGRVDLRWDGARTLFSSVAPESAGWEEVIEQQGLFT